MDGFYICASWSPEYAFDFSSQLDSKFLGVQPMDEDEMRALVRGVGERPRSSE